MSPLEHFHETRFPLGISIGAAGGPTRKTEVVSLVSGHEKRNTKWAHSQRNYNAGFGVKSVDDLQDVIAFFEERRGRLYGFRFRDPVDYKSCRPSHPINSLDQNIGIGDGKTRVFQLRKLYGSPATGYYRNIQKPIDDKTVVAIDGTMQTRNLHYFFNAMTGEIEFTQKFVPPVNAQITAGFEFDVPVRFNTDEITVNLSTFQAGEIPSIPLIEIKL